MKSIIQEDLLFEAVDVFGKRIRSTKNYWIKIKTEKHQELKFDVEEISETITSPDEAYKSVKDETVFIQFKVYGKISLVVVTKHLNGNGFLVTAYQTSKVKRKGEKLWPR